MLVAAGADRRHSRLPHGERPLREQADCPTQLRARGQNLTYGSLQPGTSEVAYPDGGEQPCMAAKQGSATYGTMGTTSGKTYVVVVGTIFCGLTSVWPRMVPYVDKPLIAPRVWMEAACGSNMHACVAIT